MEKMVKFHPAQEVPSTELNFAQESMQTSLAAVVRHLLVRSEYYVGLTVTKNSATELAIAAGRFFTDGKVYVKDSPTTLNITAYLPAGANRKKIAIVANGQTIDTDASPRKFLIDANTGAAKPRTVETRTNRVVQISVIQGAENLVAVDPVVPLGYAWLATVELSSSGVVGDPVAVTDQVAPNLEDTVAGLTLIRAELDAQLGMIRTLRTDLAALGKTVIGLAPQIDIDRLEREILMLREKTDIPDLASFYGYDLFDTDSESDDAAAGYNCTVGGGALALPMPTPTSAVAQLLNPLDARVVTHSNGVVLPAYSEVIRLEQAAKQTEISFASYAVVTKLRVKKKHGWWFKRWKHRHAALWHALKRLDGEIVVVDPTDGNPLSIDPTPYAWKLPDLPSKWGKWLYLQAGKPYWTVKNVSGSLSGYTIAQTILNAQSGWLTGVGLRFSYLGGSGDVRVIVCECHADGTPNTEEALDEVTIAYADLKLDWTKAALPPVHLAAGVRYAVVVQTNGAHRLWGSSTNGLTNGTLFYSTDNSYWDGQLQKDLDLRLYFASFNANLVTIELQPASRGGGITSLDFTFTGVRPDGADFDVQAQVAGVWKNIDDDNEAIFSAAPNLVPLRMVFQNTKDDAVGLVLTESRIIAFKQNLTAIHVSTERTLPSGTTESVVVRQLLRGYDAGQHTHAIKLLHGGSYASTKTPAATVTTVLPNGLTEIKSTFSFAGAAISTYKVKTEMTITDPAGEYVVVERWDHAL